MTSRPGRMAGGAAAALGCALVASACATVGNAPSTGPAPAKVRNAGSITDVGADEPRGFNVEILWNDLSVLLLHQIPALLAVRNSFTNFDPNPSAPTGLFWNTEQWARRTQ